MSDLQLRVFETTLEAAIANTLASSTAMVEHLNSERKKAFDSSFESWKTTVLAGKIDNLNPPQPPAAYEVVKVSSGFSYPALGSSPVCAPRIDIPPDYSKPFELKLPEPEHVRNVPPSDTMPVGFVTVDGAGRRWQKQSSVTPFGVAYFYARLS
jgi:hypothetical protein